MCIRDSNFFYVCCVFVNKIYHPLLPYHSAINADALSEIYQMGRGIEAVSYTHLDVYKRQPENSVVPAKP